MENIILRQCEQCGAMEDEGLFDASQDDYINQCNECGTEQCIQVIECSPQSEWEVEQFDLIENLNEDVTIKE